MNTRRLRNSIFLVITAAIWGFAFVAQSVGGDAVGPFLFNFLRFVIGSIVLIPVILVKDTITHGKDKPISKKDYKTLIIGGILCGLSLCVASNLQQLGINMGTPAGKAGFLTACYILIVPILGIFFKKKCPITVWIGVVITLAGLFLLCINPKEGFSINASDLVTLACAFCFSIQIMIIDKYSPLVDGVRLSCLQFAVAGVISAIPSFIFDMKADISQINTVISALSHKEAIIPVLYAGIMSCGVAYTLQIVGQNGLNPTIACLIMSLESVFSVIGGWIILHEALSSRELIGCVLVFVAICLAQIDFENIKKRPKKS
ncbi:MAG: DMT family transporter [Lachnospiraceae bacterium]|nr:DMT family transporter [Lachnospiraceae bacterium]